MALAANALTSLATVLDELGLVSDSGGAQDLRLERYINAASGLCARYCNRVFENGAAIVEKVKGYGTTKIVLSRTPIVSIASVVVDGTTVAASEYAIENAGAGIVFRANGWPNTASRHAGIVQPQLAGEEDPTRIVVTYNGGYVLTGGGRTLPHDLEDSIVELVTARWRRRGVDTRVVQQGGEATTLVFGGVPVPPEILGTWDLYARVPHA